MQTTSDVSAANPMTLLAWSRLRGDEYRAQVQADRAREDRHLPVHDHELTKVWGYNSTYRQLMPVRDKLWAIWRRPELDDEAVEVVGTHRSKSILLPVYRLEVPDIGTFTMRDNFHDWCISCDLQLPVPADAYGDLYHTDQVYGFFEGFDRGGAAVYGPFDSNQQQFSIMLRSGFEELYLFMNLTRLALRRSTLALIRA